MRPKSFTLGVLLTGLGVLASAGCGATSAPTAPITSSSFAIQTLAAPLVIGATARLHAVRVDGNGTTTEIPASGWTSSDLAVARVDSDGVLTAVTAGVTSVSAIVSGVTASLPVAVQAGTYAINGLEQPVAIGDSANLHAVVELANGASLAVNETAITWMSSNTNVARVDAHGVITGLAEGTATISVTVNGAGVTSHMARVSALRYRILGLPGVLAAGEHVTLTAVQAFADGTTLPATNGTSWATSNNSVATITNAGQLTANAAGTADVTLLVNGQRAVTENATILVNVSGAYRISWTVTSCSGWNCDNFSSGSTDVTFSQFRDAVTSKGITALWSYTFRGTVAADGSLGIESYYCTDPDTSFGNDATLHDIRLTPNGAGGFTGNGFYTFRGFALWGTCRAIVVDPTKIANVTHFLQITRR
jgi:hypothetical protein